MCKDPWQERAFAFEELRQGHVAEAQSKRKEEQDEAGARLGRATEVSVKVWVSVVRAMEANSRF